MNIEIGINTNNGFTEEQEHLILDETREAIEKGKRYTQSNTLIEKILSDSIL